MKSQSRVLTTDAELRAATQTARKLPDEAFLSTLQYHARLNVIILEMSDGKRHFIPREVIQGLGNATKKQLTNVKILGRGTGIHWPDLDASFSVDGLVEGVYGTKRWMTELGRLGGSSTSANKARASRLNGQKGGRPKKLTQRVKKSLSRGI